MYRIPNQAKMVSDIYDGFDWQEVVQMPVDSVDLNSNKIKIHSKEVVSFGSANYLGLFKDKRLIEAGVECLNKYGMLYSSSRSFTYLSINDEYESYLEKIFGLPTLPTLQTTMAHFSAMQLLMLPTDVAIIDMQAHATLQNMILLPKAGGMKVETLLHNDLVQLEQKIKYHQQNGAEKIWYVCDGIYSMYGDGAPVNDLIYLLEKYDNFYIYFDDAHGMSWTGPNGAGYIWNYLPKGHEKVVMATSLGKGFGVGGGALICPSEEIRKILKRAGASFVFCGPLHSQLLGAGIASAKIHLSDEIYIKQDLLKVNMELFVEEARKNSLPLVDYKLTPIFFMTVGRNDLAIEFNQRLRQLGYYGNLGIYPAVPYKNAGMRISITSEHTESEIKGLAAALAISLEDTLKANKLKLDDLRSSIMRSKLKVA